MDTYIGVETHRTQSRVIAMKVNNLEEIPEDRNYLCPDYLQCLETAARKNALSLGCAGCDRKRIRIPPQFTDMDLVGSIMLLFSIFYPQIRREVRNDIDVLKTVIKDRLFNGV